MPTFTFYFDDIPYVIEPADYLIGVDQNGDSEGIYSEYESSKYIGCVPAIMPMDLRED